MTNTKVVPFYLGHTVYNTRLHSTVRESDSYKRVRAAILSSPGPGIAIVSSRAFFVNKYMLVSLPTIGQRTAAYNVEIEKLYNISIFLFNCVTLLL